MPGQGGISGKLLGVAFAGGILLWSGIKGKQVSGALRDIIAGKNPATAKGTPITGVTAPGAPDLTDSGASGPLDTGAATASASQAQAIAKLLAAPYGWSTGQQWDDLVSLWNKESGWNRLADNPSSGAYGIPQALPASKMGAAANPPISSATAQIAWGLAYIKSVYGSPSEAWAHEVANNWY